MEKYIDRMYERFQRALDRLPTDTYEQREKIGNLIDRWNEWVMHRTRVAMYIEDMMAGNWKLAPSEGSPQLP